MTTISVPLNALLEKKVEELVRSGYAPNKAEVMRKALKQASEDEAVRVIIEASREAHEGKLVRGNLREILKNFPD